ncbi:hypothetical protein BDW67DRAFT_68894 [Aspergillus spinulosporus]
MLKFSHLHFYCFLSTISVFWVPLRFYLLNIKHHPWQPIFNETRIRSEPGNCSVVNLLSRSLLGGFHPCLFQKLILNSCWIRDNLIQEYIVRAKG